MEKNNVRNIVVLKNLPSNLVDEAIVILKSNKKIKNLEIVNKNKSIDSKRKNNFGNNYVLKEAEMLISNYISKVENVNKEETNEMLKKKCKKLKKYLTVLTIMLIISTVLAFL